MTANLPNSDIALSDTASQPEDQIIIPKTSASVQSSSDMRSTSCPDEQTEAHLAESSETTTKVAMDPRTKISSLLEAREQEWTALVEKQGPLGLLDMPMDVLKEIVKEVGVSLAPRIFNHAEIDIGNPHE
jgi:hypothetical protein